MTRQPRTPPGSLPALPCQVFRVQDIRVTVGANAGDAIGDAEQVCAGDVYQLARRASALNLMLEHTELLGGDAHAQQTIAAGSEVGHAGEPVELSARLTLMSPDGDRLELLILRHERTDGDLECFALPLSPMVARTDYTLIRVHDSPGAARLADLVSGAFLRGTRVALADGQQIPVEALAPGDRVLTRDHGARPVRWVGSVTLRAIGSFAPVVIAAGTLGNIGDLVVSQHHRIFIYQRSRTRIADTAELLVQAKHLVDDTGAVRIREGGFAEYFSLAFDDHEIIYAEGIPAESLMVNAAVVSRLPEELAAGIRASFPDLSQRQHFGAEATADEVGRLDRGVLGPGPRSS